MSCKGESGFASRSAHACFQNFGALVLHWDFLDFACAARSTCSKSNMQVVWGIIDEHRRPWLELGSGWGFPNWGGDVVG